MKAEWTRCGNTPYYRRKDRSVYVNPAALWILEATIYTSGMAKRGGLVEWSRLPSLNPKMITHAAWIAAPENAQDRAEFVDALATWDAGLDAMARWPVSDKIDVFKMLEPGVRDRILEGIVMVLEAFFDVDPEEGPIDPWVESRWGLVVERGGPAHRQLEHWEDLNEPTEPTIVALTLQKGMEEALSNFGILEC